MRKALVRLEQLQAEITRLTEDRDYFKAAYSRKLVDEKRALEAAQAALAANTPLKHALRKLVDPDSEPWKGLREVVKLLLMGVTETDWNETEMRARELLVLLAGAPELVRQMAAVTGTTSDKAPIRKPAAGDAKGTRNG